MNVSFCGKELSFILCIARSFIKIEPCFDTTQFRVQLGFPSVQTFTLEARYLNSMHNFDKFTFSWTSPLHCHLLTIVTFFASLWSQIHEKGLRGLFVINLETSPQPQAIFYFSEHRWTRIACTWQAKELPFRRPLVIRYASSRFLGIELFPELCFFRRIIAHSFKQTLVRVT